MTDKRQDVSAAQPMTAALIVAAGRGLRAGGGVPKQFRMLAGRPLLCWSLESLIAHPDIDRIQIVVGEGEMELAREIVASMPTDIPIAIDVGGASRQLSVYRGLLALAPHGPERVLVHDAARPLLPASLISRVCIALRQYPGVCPALPVTDSLRRGQGVIESEVPRDGLWRVQTPQGFHFQAILTAHKAAAAGATDDCEVLRQAGHDVHLVVGDERTLKVTSAGDFALVEQLLPRITVTGSGFDVHRFGDGQSIWLCGVEIPHDRSLLGHSDADVGLHALTDAILGALGDGDIGVHFPPSDPQWKGVSSDRFLAHAAQLASDAGARILHCDLTLMCEAPRIKPHRPAMIARIKEILAPHDPIISLKATTTEKLGFIGREEGMAAHALATITLPAAGVSEA